MKKAIIIILCVIAILAAGGYSAYRFYVVPNYIEPAMEKAVDVLGSEETKEKVDEIVTDLVENGVLTEDEVKKYLNPDTNIANSDEKSAENTNTVSEAKPDKPQSSAATDAPKEQNKKTSTSVYDKIKENVSPEDVQDVYSFYSRYSFLAGKSMEEIKAYAKENMSSAEIQRALELYSKYSGLLH